MDFRRYQTADYDACLEIFKGNVPKYFMETELEEYSQDLERLDDPYFVVERDGVIVAAGGYCLNAKGGGLTWGMVRRELHSQGIGRTLVQFRLACIAEDYPDQAVYIDTSQHTCPFYERMGFVAESVETDGYGPGLHKVLMKRLQLNCLRKISTPLTSSSMHSQPKPS
ncbi:GNAT family N-acetyltransferase [Pseudovibrio sp. Alg231-02]|uniref:GNAT family N-acetyltransferase n=1 Tax=Pseudovibrio sp. Alg231-02 TaxID=1922223 RepID=UPI000D560EC1|nr:GNAT family N-acetyltransferase [Pseudovibrio sp. Alg231-02]